LRAQWPELPVLILSGFPDPDGISSALAHRYLANEHGIETTILTFRDPSHQENRALLKTLDIELTLYHEDLDLSEEEYLDDDAHAQWIGRLP